MRTPNNSHCDHCRMYAWDMSHMQPVYAFGGEHHPACPVVRGIQNPNRIHQIVGAPRGHGGFGHHGGRGHGRGRFGGVALFAGPEIAYCPYGYYSDDFGRCWPLPAYMVGADPAGPLLTDDAKNMIRVRAVQLTYPDRDTSGWDPWANDPAVDATYNQLLSQVTPVGFHDPLLGDVPFPTPGSGYEAGKELGKMVPTPSDAYKLGKKVPGAAGGALDKAAGAADKFGEDLKTVAWIGGAIVLAIAGIFAYTAYKTDAPKHAFGFLKSERDRAESKVDTTARLLAK